MLWLILVEDSDNSHLYHSEMWLLTKKMAREEAQTLAFTIPIFEPLPAQYYVRAVSETWLHAEALLEVSFRWGGGAGAACLPACLLACLPAACYLLPAACCVAYLLATALLEECLSWCLVTTLITTPTATCHSSCAT
jgi:hypothetical protein